MGEGADGACAQVDLLFRDTTFADASCKIGHRVQAANTAIICFFFAYVAQIQHTKFIRRFGAIVAVHFICEKLYKIEFV